MGMHALTARSWECLGNHLREARATQRVSQEFLASWIGVDHRTVARIEVGRMAPSVAHLSAMELALGLRPGASFEVLADVSNPHLPSQAPTRLQLSLETTLCGHDPRCG
ncbi:helix-turn-helix transcriptional regulator [Streptomyces cacaoi]